MTNQNSALKYFTIAALAAFGLASAAVAQTTVASDPVGVVNLTIPAAPSGSLPSRTSICLPVYEHTPTGAGQTVGRVTGVTSNTISNSNGGWTAGTFAQTGSPFFIRFLSGNATGRTLQITANTATQLTINNQGTDLTSLGITTDRYEIFPGDTLSSFFGTSTAGNPNADLADNVVIWDGSAWQTFFYDTGDNRWERKGFNVTANNVVLRPDAAIMFVRRLTSPLTITLLGRVPVTNLRYMVGNGGSTFVGNGFPAAVSLATHAFNTLPGWVSKPQNEAEQADKVIVWDGSAWQRYFFDSIDNRWERIGFNVTANNVVLAVGRPVMIQRASASATGTTAFVHQLPYNLNL